MAGKLLGICIAGALGALCRYGLSGLVHKIGGAGFPWGTLVVNMTGCFLVGLLWALFENRFSLSPEIRIVVLVGFMGAFTTFSAFALETGELLRSSGFLYASANILLHNGLGLALLLAGQALGKTA